VVTASFMAPARNTVKIRLGTHSRTFDGIWLSPINHSRHEYLRRHGIHAVLHDLVLGNFCSARACRSD
jgi:hypothetical protein